MTATSLYPCGDLNLTAEYFLSPSFNALINLTFLPVQYLLFLPNKIDLGNHRMVVVCVCLCVCVCGGGSSVSCPVSVSSDQPLSFLPSRPPSFPFLFAQPLPGKWKGSVRHANLPTACSLLPTLLTPALMSHVFSYVLDSLSQNVWFETNRPSRL